LTLVGCVTKPRHDATGAISPSIHACPPRRVRLCRSPRSSTNVKYALSRRTVQHTEPNDSMSVESDLDTTTYPTTAKVSNDEMTTIHLRLDAFHGEWNDTILPHVT